METEKERKQVEELIYLPEYLTLIETLSIIAPKCPSREFDQMMKDVTFALHEKVEYILKISSEYRSELNWWERIKEHFRAKRDKKHRLQLALEEEQRLAEEKAKAQPVEEPQSDAVAQQDDNVTNMVALPASQEAGLLETKDGHSLQIEDKTAKTDSEGDVLRF